MTKIIAPEVETKNGQLPAPNVQLHKSIFPKGLEEMVSNWDIKLLLVMNPEYIDRVFVVKLASTWGGTKPIYFLCSDFFDKKKQQEITKELVNRGVFDPERDFEAIVEYINCLKKAGRFTLDDAGYTQHIMETADLTDDEDSFDYYKQIVEYVNENRKVFPDRSSNAFNEDWCHGVHLNESNQIKKFGQHAFAIIPEHLRNLLDIPNKKKYGAILDDLVKKGFLYCGGGKDPRKDIVVSLSEMVSKKVYVFTIDTSVLNDRGVDNV